MNQYKAVATTLTKVFLGAVFAQLITLQIGVTDVSSNQWAGVLNAGLSAVLVTAYNWLDVTDTRYGRGHE
jgi:hypothetical protein